MPYIRQEKRNQMKKALGDLASATESAGDLNYAITKLVHLWVKRYAPVNYALLNNVIGILESAKLEFYRRVVAPYEEIKIIENGDI